MNELTHWKDNGYGHVRQPPAKRNFAQEQAERDLEKQPVPDTDRKPEPEQR